MLGRASHGLRLLPRYARELAEGTLLGRGRPEVIRDHEASVAWDGKLLPGPSLVLSAIETLRERAARLGQATVAIRGSGHIAALAAYLQYATRDGFLILIASASPGATVVAPFGSRQGRLGSCPLACGIPTSGDPILIDISTGMTSNNTCHQYARDGKRLPGNWIIDRAGTPTDDPAVLKTPGASILPLGGLDAGHKGFALALMVSALCIGLSGMAEPLENTGGHSVFVSLFDPDRFGGGQVFMDAMLDLATACRAAEPAPYANGVRIPGDKALRLRRAALADGLDLPENLAAELRSLGAQHAVAFPGEINV
jgi:L-lactate dehydrogenase